MEWEEFYEYSDTWDRELFVFVLSSHLKSLGESDEILDLIFRLSGEPRELFLLRVAAEQTAFSYDQMLDLCTELDVREFDRLLQIFSQQNPHLGISERAELKDYYVDYEKLSPESQYFLDPFSRPGNQTVDSCDESSTRYDVSSSMKAASKTQLPSNDTDDKVPQAADAPFDATVDHNAASFQITFEDLVDYLENSKGEDRSKSAVLAYIGKKNRSLSPEECMSLSDYVDDLTWLLSNTEGRLTADQLKTSSSLVTDDSFESLLLEQLQQYGGYAPTDTMALLPQVIHARVGDTLVAESLYAGNHFRPLQVIDAIDHVSVEAIEAMIHSMEGTFTYGEAQDLASSYFFDNGEVMSAICAHTSCSEKRKRSIFECNTPTLALEYKQKLEAAELIKQRTDDGAVAAEFKGTRRSWLGQDIKVWAILFEDGNVKKMEFPTGDSRNTLANAMPDIDTYHKWEAIAKTSVRYYATPPNDSFAQNWIDKMHRLLAKGDVL